MYEVTKKIVITKEVKLCTPTSMQLNIVFKSEDVYFSYIYIFNILNLQKILMEFYCSTLVKLYLHKYIKI
jgi:hypothetical protein